MAGQRTRTRGWGTQRTPARSWPVTIGLASARGGQEGTRTAAIHTMRRVYGKARAGEESYAPRRSTP